MCFYEKKSQKNIFSVGDRVSERALEIIIVSCIYPKYPEEDGDKMGPFLLGVPWVLLFVNVLCEDKNVSG